jgi:hypothetical protein
MISDGAFRKLGHSPYFQIADQNREFVSKISSKNYVDFLNNLSSVWKNVASKFVKYNI